MCRRNSRRTRTEIWGAVALSADLKLPLKLLMKTNRKARLVAVEVPSARPRKRLPRRLRSKRRKVVEIPTKRAAALSARQPRRQLRRRLIAARRVTINPPAPAQKPKKTVVAVAKKMLVMLQRKIRSLAKRKSLI